MAAPLPIAGWYPDPEFPGHDRWWDGTDWSDQRRASASGVPSRSAPPQPPATASALVPVQRIPVQRNGFALTGFLLSASGVLLPFVLNSFAGAIVSIIGLQRSKQLAGSGVLSHGRGLSIAGILIGFIWGGLTLLCLVGFVMFSWWVFSAEQHVQFPDSPVG